MKTNVATFLLTMALASSALAGSTKLFSCKGSENNSFYSLDIYQGDAGYSAGFVLKTNRGTYNIPATGHAYIECGSRSVPCQMIQIAQFSSTTPYMIFTMISATGSKTGSGSLDFYSGTPPIETHKVTLLCEK